MRFSVPILCGAVFILAIQAEDAVKSRIMNPINAPVSQFPYAARLMFSFTNNPTAYEIGSGVLITRNLVMTAGHCARDPQTGAGLATMGVTLNGVQYSISGAFVNPTWTGASNTDGDIDAAILVLSTDTEIQPLSIYRGLVPVGTQLTLVGFGETGTGITGEQMILPPDGTVNYGFTTVQSVTANYMHWSFQAGSQTTAHGDSGGPSMVTLDTQQFGRIVKLAGLCESGQDPQVYGDTANHILVPSIMQWVDSVAKFTNVAASSENHAFVAFRGQSFAMDATLTNNSFNAAPPFLVGVSLSKTPTFDSNGPILFDGVAPNGLAARTVLDQTLTGPIPSTIAPGAYYVNYQIDPQRLLFESDATDNFFSGIAPVAILDERAAIGLKKKFTTDFKASGKDGLSVTFNLPSELIFSSKTEFVTETNGQTLNVFLGGGQIGTQTILNGRGTGTGHMLWNYKKGTIQYTLTNAQLEKFLLPYGAVNASTTKTVLVPIWFEFKGVFYGAQASFLYVGSQGMGGKGS